MVNHNIGVKGDIILGRDLVSSSGRSLLNPRPLIVRSQEDLNRANLVGSFVPILIPPDANLTTLNFSLCCFYNRHIQVLNRTPNTIQLILPFLITTRSFSLSSGRYANITIFVEDCELPYGVADLPYSPVTLECFLTYDLTPSQTFQSFVASLVNPINQAFIGSPYPVITEVRQENSFAELLTYVILGEGVRELIATTTLFQQGHRVMLESDNSAICQSIRTFLGPPPPPESSCYFRYTLNTQVPTIDAFANLAETSIVSYLTSTGARNPVVTITVNGEQRILFVSVCSPDNIEVCIPVTEGSLILDPSGESIFVISSSGPYGSFCNAVASIPGIEPLFIG